MKKNFQLISSLLIALTLFSWTGINSPKQVKAANINTSASILDNSSACNNIFFPLEAGNQWKYKLDAQMENYIGHEKQDFISEMTLSISEDDQSDILLNQLNSESNTEKQSPVQCEDQAILMYPLIELNMIIGDMANSLDIEYVSGTFMPTRKDFEDNNWSLDWETEYKTSGTLEANYEGKSFKAIFAESPVEMSWEVISTDESQDVPAGSFEDLVKINRKIEIDVTSMNAEIKGKQVNIGTTLIIETDMYFAADIGLIKQTINKASIKLFGIKIPLEVQGSMELESYTFN